VAQEFSLDRRTVSKKLNAAGVQPCDTVKGSAVYGLVDVLDALRPQVTHEVESMQSRADAMHAIQRICVLQPFISAERPALVILWHTQLSPEKVLDLIVELWSAFEANAHELLGRTKFPKILPIELHDAEQRVALLKRFRAERGP
jgi:hypothetical protein